MTYLFLSPTNTLLPLYQRVSSTITSYYLSSTLPPLPVNTPNTRLPLATPSGKPLLPHIKLLLREVNPDIVVAEQGVSGVGDVIRGLGIRVVGGGKWATLSSTSPDYGGQLAHLVGMEMERREGIRVGVGAWWNGAISSLHSISIPYLTSSYTSLYLHRGARLVSSTIRKMEQLLLRTNYKGPLTIWVTVWEGKVSYEGMEVGFNLTHPSLLTTLRSDITLLLQTCTSPEVGWAGVRVSGDYSLSASIQADEEGSYLTPTGLVPESERYVWQGPHLCVTARGVSVRECRRRVERTLKGIKTPHSHWVNGSGVFGEEGIRRLKQWDWL